MTEIVHGAVEMIGGMTPELRPGRFVFASIGRNEPGLEAQAIASFREGEGMSLILPEDVARAAGLPVEMPMRLITLNVYSSLEGVGLTAAVAGALAAQGIACNMVAACHHDHVFVPADRADEAIGVLLELQRDAS